VKVEDLVKEYLPTKKVMQLATSADDQPYVCNIHYYSDEDFNFYWRSTLARKHSQDIGKNPKVSVTILAHENTPDENYVVGITVVGTAELLGKEIDGQIGDAYCTKLGLRPELLTDIANGKDAHRFYKLKPTKIVLFDNKNFPENPRRELSLT
jgi:uncharacterized protein YhbP (UPF0306 family)